MSVFLDHLTREVRLERMRPAQVEQARLERPAIYVPFGSIEWHGIQNPVGLDAIKAHEQLVGLAARAGGVVYPAVFFGSGGGHTAYPHTYMVEPQPMLQIVTDLLWGFERVGYQKAVLLSGHYPNRTQYLDIAICRYVEAGGKLQVLALVENQVPGGKGDHAALYETSFMLYLHPDTVEMRLLVDLPGETIDPQAVTNFMDEKYLDHPCYGLLGMDPRHQATPELGHAMTDNLLKYLQAWLDS